MAKKIELAPVHRIFDPEGNVTESTIKTVSRHIVLTKYMVPKSSTVLFTELGLSTAPYPCFCGGELMFGAYCKQWEYDPINWSAPVIPRQYEENEGKSGSAWYEVRGVTDAKSAFDHAAGSLLNAVTQRALNSRRNTLVFIDNKHGGLMQLYMSALSDETSPFIKRRRFGTTASNWFTNANSGELCRHHVIHIQGEHDYDIPTHTDEWFRAHKQMERQTYMSDTFVYNNVNHYLIRT